MLRTVSAVLLTVLTATACAPMPQPAAPPVPGDPGQEAAADNAVPPSMAGEPEMKALPPVDVRHLTCSALNSASDDDKAYAATFLLGYRSGLMHQHVLDTKKIDAIEQAALADCAAKPDEAAGRVFAEAQAKVELSMNPSAPHRLHHRLPRMTPAATPGFSEPPSMRYAPAAGPPASAEPGEAEPAETPAKSSPAEDGSR
jgi:hypothetical protein